MSTSLKLRHATVMAAVGALLTLAAFAQDPVVLTPRDKGITLEQRANVRERVALANAILDRHQAEAESLELSDSWRQPLLQRLLPLPAKTLKGLENAGSLAELSSAIAGLTPEPLAFGSTSEDLVYKPITPCRYIDTRYAGGRISGSRGFDIFQAGSVWGGDAACHPRVLFGVDENSFGGLAMNVTIFAPVSAPGYAAIKPNVAPGSPTSSLVNWYESGPSVQIANQGILTLDQSIEGAEFYVITSSSVHVIVDVFGAFVAPHATALETVKADVTYTLSPTHTLFTNSPACPAGYTMTGGGAVIPPGYTTIALMMSHPNDTRDRWVCTWKNNGPSDVNVTCRALCARVPGR